MVVTMHLDKEPFELVKNGSKTIEMRLYDSKRKKLKVGDYMNFINKDNSEELLTVVDNLYVYPNFEELYKHFDKTSLGYLPDEKEDPKDMEKYYSKKDQDKYGVIGIKVRKLGD